MIDFLSPVWRIKGKHLEEMVSGKGGALTIVFRGFNLPAPEIIVPNIAKYGTTGIFNFFPPFTKTIVWT